jgi:hypothetical protein
MMFPNLIHLRSCFLHLFVLVGTGCVFVSPLGFAFVFDCLQKCLLVVSEELLVELVELCFALLEFLEVGRLLSMFSPLGLS